MLRRSMPIIVVAVVVVCAPSRMSRGRGPFDGSRLNT